MLVPGIPKCITEDERLFIKEWASGIRTYYEVVSSISREDVESCRLYNRALIVVPEEVFTEITELFGDGKVAVDDETGLVVYLDSRGTLRVTSEEPPPLLTKKPDVSGWNILKAIDRGIEERKKSKTDNPDYLDLFRN